MSDEQTSETSVIGRGMRLLECFSGRREVLTVGSLVHATGLPPATVHRLLRSFSEIGYIEKIGRGKYQLGVKMWQLGASAPIARNLRDIALPHLQDLHVATRHVVHLAMADGLELLYVEKLAGQDSVKLTSRVGRRFPLHATALGKVLLAYGDEEQLHAVIAAGLSKRTAHTISTEHGLRAELANIRTRGLAESINEYSMGTASVAAPLFRGESGPIVAAISIVATDTEGIDPREVAALRAVSRAITRGLGRECPDFDERGRQAATQARSRS